MQVTFLKLLRVAAGYSQKEVAGLLKIDASLISRYESGSRPMPKAVKKAFVEACAQKVDWKALVRRAAR